VGTNVWKKKPQTTKICKESLPPIHTHTLKIHNRITGGSIYLIEEGRKDRNSAVRGKIGRERESS